MTARRYRSLLFVPGHKPEWARRAATSGVDGLIIDLEDSVPDERKPEARQSCAAVLDELADSSVGRFVRLNEWGSGRLVGDVAAVVEHAPTGFMLPKASDAFDVVALDRVLSEVEHERGLPVGATEILPVFESANGFRNVFEICTASTRVRRCSGGPSASPWGDTNRSLGYEWTPGGLETLYMSSRAVLDAKSAGMDQVFGGTTTDIRDLDLLRTTAVRARQLGCFGTVLLHPGQIPVAHEVFTPGARELADAADVLAAMDEALARGDAATTLRGRMVDIAHARYAAQVLADAAAYGLDVAPVAPQWLTRE